MWTDGGVTIRLDGLRPLDAALAVARTMKLTEPAGHSRCIQPEQPEEVPMRWRMPVFISTLGVIVLVWASPATREGTRPGHYHRPGLAKPIIVAGYGEPGSVGNLGELSRLAAVLFVAMFGPDGENQLVIAAPAGTLGPRYDLTYRVPDGTPNGGLVRQDLYPGAAGGPVTYTAAGQPVFGTVTTVAGSGHRPRSACCCRRSGCPRGPSRPWRTEAQRDRQRGRRSATTPTRGSPWLPIALVALFGIVAAVAASRWLVRRRT
jgi:hypothetical protein